MSANHVRSSGDTDHALVRQLSAEADQLDKLLKRQRVFDAHMHIIDPAFRIRTNQGYRPAVFSVDQYRIAADKLKITGGAVVAGSYHGFDRRHITSALAKLGPSFVGVAQLKRETTVAEIRQLDAAGVRAIRFNLERGTWTSRDDMASLANRAYDACGWHVELYVRSTQLEAVLTASRFAGPVVVDHLGMTGQGTTALLRHVYNGGYVKASGFGRVDFDIVSTLKELVRVNPEAVIFGTDLPSTRARRPFSVSDLALVHNALDEETTERVLWTNAIRLYRPGL